jgi:hypothetical protein
MLTLQVSRKCRDRPEYRCTAGYYRDIGCNSHSKPPMGRRDEAAAGLLLYYLTLVALKYKRFSLVALGQPESSMLQALRLGRIFIELPA